MRPKTILFHDGKTGPIRWVKKPRAGGTEVDGYSIIPERKTAVRSNASYKRQAMILLHELHHHAMSPIVTDKPVFQGDLEEIIIQTISSNMAEIWRRNPTLFTWIHLGLTAEES